MGHNSTLMVFEAQVCRSESLARSLLWPATWLFLSLALALRSLEPTNSEGHTQHTLSLVFLLLLFLFLSSLLNLADGSHSATYTTTNCYNIQKPAMVFSAQPKLRLTRIIRLSAHVFASPFSLSFLLRLMYSISISVLVTVVDQSFIRITPDIWNFTFTSRWKAQIFN